MTIRRIVPLMLLFSVPWLGCSPSTPDEPVQQTARFIAGDAASLERAEELALAHLLENQPELLEGVAEIWTKRVRIDHLGQAHTRVLQTVDNVPVFGAEAIVHLDADGAFRFMTDGFVRHIRVDTTPKYRELEAIDLAVAAVGGWDWVQGIPVADLQILRYGRADHLTYRVQLTTIDGAGAPAMPVVFIDAHTGELVWHYNNLQTARDRRTYDANNGSSLPGTLVRTEGSSPSGDAVIDAAHDNAGLTYDFYFENFGRDSFDDAGATMHSTAHYGVNYVNAFWNGSQMVYGDGDGVDSDPLTVTDVVAHELTHAVTSYESDLIYSNESGALNEAMSDIFGAAVEAYRDGGVDAATWLIGEECWTPGIAGDALRYMHDPALADDTDYYPDRYTGFEDNGGVHINSGIANLAFYLLSEGGTHPRGKTSVVVPAIGIDSAQRIFYRANTVYLTPSSQFSDARVATVNAAGDLFGAAEVAAVEAAWDAVGVLPPPDYQIIDEQANLSGGQDSELRFEYVTPSGATHIKFEIAGGSGDADLYVQFGSEPTLSSYDCRPYRAGNTEVCEFTPAEQGTYHVMLHGYSSYSGVTMTVSAAGGDGEPPPAEVCDDGADNDGDGDIDCDDSDCAADPVCEAPATTMHLGDLDGSSVASGRNWTATVSILVVDDAGSAVADATVSGNWSAGFSGPDSCVTGADGRCSVSSGNIHKRDGATAFTVGDVSHASLSYQSADNTDPDGDSNGTGIVVSKP